MNKVSAIVLLSLTACNYDVGECWVRGEGPGGVGGGVITLTTGSGDFGDVPPEPRGAEESTECKDTEPSRRGDDSPSHVDAPSDSDVPYEAGLKVFCTKPDHGATCSERCFAKGVGCVALAVHPYKPDGGNGKLFSCNDLMLGYMCGYHYPNGDDCYYPFGGLPFPKVCSYSGND